MSHRKFSLIHVVRAILVAIFTLATSTNALVSPIYKSIQQANVIDPMTGEECSPLKEIPASSEGSNKKSLVVVLPQLGEFDSSEFCEHLVAVESELDDAGIELCVIGIGDDKCAKSFATFTGLSLSKLKVDPIGSIHKKLQLHAGPNWDVPDFISDEVLTFLLQTLPGGAPKGNNASTLLRPTARAWLNYLLMCAGIGAPGTLPEILRGYFGDFSAPERFAEDDVVKAGFITIGPGVGPVKIGPLSYSQWWEDERGYQRPVELATVRLKNMVEVLTKWDTYVTDPTIIDKRGATFLFSESGEILYQYRHRGVLTYSETMSRPLTFLSQYIGEDVAMNPLGMLDNGNEKSRNKHGRGILKPAGRLMNLFKPLFSLETTLQAKLLGANDQDFQSAQQDINEAISSNHVVIYTYGLSPFSTEAIALLEDAGCKDYKKIEIGPEWFLLGKEGSVLRSALLSKTSQSSLPHIFIGGKHIGGLFSGTKDGGPGIAALQEAGELRKLFLEVPAKIALQ